MKLGEDMLNELHSILYEQLIFFKEFCEKNNLVFFLAYGSCLGAIREHGFIPWDDDVDIIMPPNDFLRLKELWKPLTSIGKYTLCDTTRNYIDHHATLTIRNEETTYINDGDVDSDTNHGIMIEIVPYTYLPKTIIGRIMQDAGLILNLIFRTQREPNSGGKVQKIIVRLLLNVFRTKDIRYKIWNYFEKYKTNHNDSLYVRSLGQFHTFSKLYPVEIFEKAVWVPFGNTTMPVPAGYDKYLKILYKDYMTPPPRDERVPVHEVLFIDCKKSYREYKGVYYLKGNKNS
ncbi:MAG: LicD family protein [Dorea sp.]|jgi:lipopolysaccharide cholinephosphotransferase|nr:LicD family protein [Dorea sp.]